MQQKRALRSGFSLIELMVVIIILGLLAALVMPNVLGQGEQAKSRIACVQMKSVAQALESFRMDNGRYPSTEEGLSALASNPDPEKFTGYLPGGYLNNKGALNDPWNNPYIYIQEGSGFDILSLGADGEEGGSGHDRDLRLSECD
jgi:general secretion pathway protein G